VFKVSAMAIGPNDGMFRSHEESLKLGRSLIGRETRSLLVIGFFLNLLVLVSPLYMLQIYDRVLTAGSTDTLLYLTILALFALLIYGVLELLRSKTLTRIGFVLEDLLHGPALSAWLDSSQKTGLSGKSALADLQRVRSFLQGGAPTAIFDAPWAPAFLAVLFLLHPLLGIIGVLATIVLVVMAIANDLGARKSLTQSASIKSAADELVRSSVANADTIASMGMADTVVSRHRKGGIAAAEVELKGLDRISSVTSFSKAFRVAVQVIILGAGAYLVLQNSLTSGGMIAATILLGRALAPAEQAIGAWRQIVPAREAWKRLNQQIAALPHNSGKLKLPAPTGSLKVEQAGFDGEPGMPPVLSDINFALMPGDICAVLGPTGAGKSTLCRVVTGALPLTNGKVRLDETAVENWAATQIGSQIGYVSQDAEIFQGSIAENISRLDDPDSELVVEAAKAAGIYEIVARLPQGFATPVGPGGLRLSGGQRQRISLARALYNSPRYLVLDEPNANLDEEGERALRNAVSAAQARGATTLLVVHHGHLLSIANKILVLRNGRQELFGDREEVTAKFRQIFRAVQPNAESLPTIPTEREVTAQNLGPSAAELTDARAIPAISNVSSS
jgi:PrtD family type I secretion system ABC transporter